LTIKKRIFISGIMVQVLLVFMYAVILITTFIIIEIFTDASPFEVARGVLDITATQRVDAFPVFIIGATAVISSFFIVAFFLHRFMAIFVFNKISQPLEMLSDGVSQIHEGNLAHRISYTGNDEFKPVCEDFNDMAVRLKDSIEKVQKSEQSRKELLAGISHDLRTPLSSIQGFAEGLLDGAANNPETREKYVQIIKRKAEEMNTMVSQIFAYSKMDMGDYPNHPEILDIAEELIDFVHVSKEEHHANGLTVDIVHIPTKRYINVDPLQLRSIFANILGNSAKYKTKETAQATIHCTAAHGIITLIFEDDGGGVPTASLTRIFDAFYRVDVSRTNPHKGSGLGLAITAKAIERMNGTVTAENINKGGFRVIVQIPENGGRLQ